MGRTVDMMYITYLFPYSSINLIFHANLRRGKEHGIRFCEGPWLINGYTAPIQTQILAMFA